MTNSDVQRAGLYLTGSLEDYFGNRLLFLGKQEVNYLQSLEPSVQRERLEAVIKEETPAVVITRNNEPSQELLSVCREKNIPLFSSGHKTITFFSKINRLLTEEFAPVASRHGTLVEVFDVGVLIEGDSSIGKSETALGLIERGHRLISDDIVRIKKREASYLEGQGAELTRHHMEIRGIGIINVANLYGAFCVKDKKNIDMIVKLEVWDDTTFYDRVGVEEQTINILEVDVPYATLPVKPGRDVVLLLETMALNHRLKKMGFHSAKEFHSRLSQTIIAKTPKKGRLAYEATANSLCEK